MNLTPLKLITIIAEDELEDRLVHELKALGATGYTVLKARGEGTHRARISHWEGENIQLEALVSEPVADKIIELLSSSYFDNYSVIFYVTDVRVLRGEKFMPPRRDGNT